MADQMGGGPPSPALWEMIARLWQPIYAVPGMIGAAVWAIGAPTGSVWARVRYLIAGSMMVLAVGPLAGPLLVSLLIRWGFPAAGGEMMAGFLAGAGGLQILAAVLAAARWRIAQLGGLPRDPPARG